MQSLSADFFFTDKVPACARHGLSSDAISLIVLVPRPFHRATEHGSDQSLLQYKGTTFAFRFKYHIQSRVSDVLLAWYQDVRKKSLLIVKISKVFKHKLLDQILLLTYTSYFSVVSFILATSAALGLANCRGGFEIQLIRLLIFGDIDCLSQQRGEPKFSTALAPPSSDASFV